MRHVYGLALLTFLLALAGCSGGSGKDSDPKDYRAAMRSFVQSISVYA
jgi:hypothetical protein